MAKNPLLLFVFFFLTPIQAMGSPSYSGFTYDATRKMAADSTEGVPKPPSSSTVAEPEKKKQPEQTLAFHELFSFTDRFDWLLMAAQSPKPKFFFSTPSKFGVRSPIQKPLLILTSPEFRQTEVELGFREVFPRDGVLLRVLPFQRLHRPKSHLISKSIVSKSRDPLITRNQLSSMFICEASLQRWKFGSSIVAP